MKRMQKAELMPSIYKKIRAYLKPNDTNKITYLDIDWMFAELGLSRSELLEVVA